MFDRHRRLGRPCILFDINKCSGPCVGKVTPDEHRQIVEDFVTFMDGRTRPTLQRLEAEMRQAAEELNFELAARLRDQLGSVRKAMERQQMVSSTPEDFDIAAFAEDDLEAAVQVFFVRRGRVVGRRGFVVDKVEALDTASLAATFVQQLYGDRADEVPREVFLPVLPEGADGLRAWLAGLRGGPVDFRVPRRGEAGPAGDGRGQRPRGLRHPQAQAGQRLRRPGPGLKELQEALDLPEAPLRIECYDISNLQGSQVVGSMVVFEDGLARKSEYRRFEVRSVEGQDDVASLREVLTRRLARLATERDSRRTKGRRKVRLPAQPDRGRRWPAPAGRRPGRGAGLGQPRPARGVAGQADGGGARAGHARPGGHPPDQRGPVPPQRVRDEAHRFAITYHRKLRDRSMTRSVLDGIPGVGETRQRQLVRHFGSAREPPRPAWRSWRRFRGRPPAC